MMSSKDNGFTAGDIERYHSGKMLPEERHALEKAALDDPFLADALEGYAFTSTPQDDIAKVQARLHEKLDRKKLIPLFQRFKWLSVAAIVLIIAGAGWFAYNISQKQNNASVTALDRNQQVKDSNATIGSQRVIKDSVKDKTIQTETDLIEANQQKIAGSHKKKLDSSSLRLHRQSGNADNKNKEVNGDGKADLVSKAVSAPSQNEIAGTTSTFSSNPRSNKAMNNAISAEPRLANASNNITRRDLFLKKAENNNGELAARVNGTRTNDSITNLNIVLKPLPADSLKEIVVGYGTQKQTTEKFPHVIIDTLEPAEGYIHFDDYVANNLKMPQEFKDKPVSGEVQLSFDVDKDGQPTNISVVKSLCQKCDEEAIRLLKEGPKWKKKKNKKGIITIRF